MSTVKHIALIKFKPTTSPKEIKSCFEEIEGMQKSIPSIVEYQMGLYSSPEGLNKGYTHGFIMTFKNAAQRDAYLVHPEHERVKDIALPLIEDVVVFDFEA